MTTPSGQYSGVLTRLLAIGRALSGEASLPDVLQRIMDAAIDVTGAERGFLCLLEEGELRPAVARNLDREEVQNAQKKLSQSVIRQVIEERQPLLSLDAPTDPRLAQSKSVRGLHIRSVVCIPLIVLPPPTPEEPDPEDPDVIGVIYLDHRFESGLFARADVDLLEIFGAYAALAVKAARLVDLLEARNAQLNTRLESSTDELSRTRHLLDDVLADAPERHDLPGVIYASRAMHRILGLLVRIASQPLPILFTGESGTGKERLARAVHELSGRRGAFVAVNCGAIAKDLFESELFGHRRGAFTGAHDDRAGLMESANHGTLFLDEVADLSPAHQVKLLRALQEGEVRRVGEDRTRKVDVRVLSATNRDLDQAIAEGRFREDLFYRLAVFHIEIPPLRERPEDIPLLADRIAARIVGGPEAEAAGAGTIVEEDAHTLLANYTWPGNVRELENEIRRALALGSGRITPNELSPAVFKAPRRKPTFAGLAAPGRTLEEILEVVEHEVIAKALERNGGNKSKTADELGISRNGLAMKMARLGLGPSRG